MEKSSGAQRAGIVGVFDRAAATCDRVGPRFFAEFGRRLVARARLDPEAALLDVAVGRGAVLFPAAERVGPGGRVIGIDMAPDMVRQTADEVRRGGWPQVGIREMDAEHLDFAEASFDWVLCGFALWFFPQPGPSASSSACSDPVDDSVFVWRSR